MSQLDTPIEYAEMLYASAIEFYEAYRAIAKNTDNRHDFVAMKHYLLCHALELTLKGWLMKTGKYNEKMLKGKKFGHNLVALADEVKKVYGRNNDLDTCYGAALVLNEDYHSKGYEYPSVSFKGLAHPDDFAKALSAYTQALIASILEEKRGRV